MNTTKSRRKDHRWFEENAVLIVCSGAGINELKAMVRDSENFFRVAELTNIGNFRTGGRK